MKYILNFKILQWFFIPLILVGCSHSKNDKNFSFRTIEPKIVLDQIQEGEKKIEVEIDIPLPLPAPTPENILPPMPDLSLIPELPAMEPPKPKFPESTKPLLTFPPKEEHAPVGSRN